MLKRIKKLTLLKCFINRFGFGVCLFIGTSFLSFLLMVYFASDQTYVLLGKNPIQDDIQKLQVQLGYHDPFYLRYFKFLVEILTMDFGYSYIRNDEVTNILKDTIPTSFLLLGPGFILGHSLSIFCAVMSIEYRGSYFDKLFQVVISVGMSLM
jgi:ABC-type dipeptide/oligopeptide/nickel transport system permease component